MSDPRATPLARVRFGGMQGRDGYLFELSGGNLCLDLANTVDERPTDHPRELLSSYTDLIDWGAQARAISTAERRELRALAAGDPGAGGQVLARAIELREAVFAIFSAVASGRSVPADALEVLNQMIAEVATKRRIAMPVRGRFAWTWDEAGSADLARVLWPVVWSAAELLTSEDASRVRQCAGADCAWLFIDTSKNRARRWCDMSVCGNRAKARRHYAKVHQQGAGGE